MDVVTLIHAWTADTYTYRVHAATYTFCEFLDHVQ